MAKAAALLAGLFLAGCQSLQLGYHVETTPTSQRSAYGASVSVGSRDRLINGMVAALLLAEGTRYYLLGADGSPRSVEYLPEPDPGRLINIQDCTRAVDPQRGNLMCR